MQPLSSSLEARAAGPHCRRAACAPRIAVGNVPHGRLAKRGATRSNDRGIGRVLPPWITRFARIAMVCGVLVALGAAGYFGKTFIDQATQRPVNSIGVEGQFVYISRQEISDLVAPMVVGGFLQSPLPEIKAALESNPWIAQAAVSRRWPDKLFISIVEEQPIARWGDVGFLNHQGEIVTVPNHPRLQSLPLLAGNPGQEKGVMQHYQQLAQTLHPYGLKISGFYSDTLFSWHVVLTNGLEIAIGRDQAMEKIQRFLVVYNRGLHKQLDDVAMIDLRYGNGLAVQWKTATADSKSSGKTDKKA